MSGNGKYAEACRMLAGCKQYIIDSVDMAVGRAVARRNQFSRFQNLPRVFWRDIEEIVPGFGYLRGKASENEKKKGDDILDDFRNLVRKLAQKKVEQMYPRLVDTKSETPRTAGFRRR